MPPDPAPLIAIVDDDESLRAALLGLLRSLGFRGRSYGSSEEFLADGAAAPCDCLLTDYHLPGLSGLELLRRLQSEGSPMPVIVMSGRNETGLRERVFAAGGLCLLTKPFTESQLLHCLGRALPGRGVDLD